MTETARALPDPPHLRTDRPWPAPTDRPTAQVPSAQHLPFLRAAGSAVSDADRPVRPDAAGRMRITASDRRRRLAHRSFAALVAAPVMASAIYLWGFAADQFHSEVAFSVRSEDRGSAMSAGLLGAITQIGGGSASDAEILEDYIRSPSMVEAVDRRLNLRRLYAGSPQDPVFGLGPGASREALSDHWQRMVHVAFDRQAGILTVRAEAFGAQDARAVAAAVLAESSRLVNDLSEQARRDAVRFSETDLAEAEARLRKLRAALAVLRRDTRVLDPQADMAGQMGVVGALQSELAQALIDRDMLLTYADPADRRVVQADARIAATRAQIAAERGSLGMDAAGAATEATASEVMGQYEELLTDIEFASAAYMQALTNLSVARAEARRQTRYLPVHIQPTLAETALYPRRLMLIAMVAGGLMLGWASLMVLFYNLRDTR
jgi:capsular polysaccharide transport system permease protein